jgi:hypothetical protein
VLDALGEAAFFVELGGFLVALEEFVGEVEGKREVGAGRERGL